ncbi:MAG: aspartate/glutamate racemase family protein [Lachnospiraceae bacterium]
MKIFTINTVNNFMELIYNPFGKPFVEENPDVQVHNIMDDSLLSETLGNGGVTNDVCMRMLSYAQSAQLCGADGIIVTCTSVNEATERIKKFVNIPMINIEEPVAEMAVENGVKIGVMGTIPTSPIAIGRTIIQKAKEANKEIEIVNCVVDGAFDILCAGDRDKHDEMVCEAMYQLAKEVDVIVFAQISMSLLKHEPIEIPLYKVGKTGFEKLKGMIEEQK